MMEELDSRIYALEVELLELKSRRNSFVHICRLPSEILVIVFRHLQFLDDAPESTFLWRAFDYSWTRVMRVCRRLRETAVRAPCLWNVIIYDTESMSKEWRELCLQRSGNSPLCVYSDSIDVCQHWHRVCSAELKGPKIADILIIPSPCIKVLTIDHINYEEEEEEEDQAPRLPASLLSNASSSLVHLRLLGDITLDGAPFMPSLRHLDIDMALTDVELASIVHLLTQTPALEELSVSRIMYTASHAPNSGKFIQVPSPVSLPHLRELILDDASSEASALLRLVPSPRSVLRITSVLDLNSFGPNHIQLYDSWRSFRCKQTSEAELIDGQISFEYGYHRATRPIIVFSSVAPAMHYAQDGNFCQMGFELESAHPMLDQIITLRLRADPREGLPGDFDQHFGLRFVNNLHTLILYAFSKRQRVCIQPIKAWISGRQGKIKTVRFVECHVRIIQEMTHELEGLVSEIVQSSC
jgi:hypothetical protein